ncbi:MAG: DUF481 domain-containing protein [Kiritimatiellae bacterium]|nr:DUF481 domain-containing protein [Kiritimatiellia bacterium]
MHQTVSILGFVFAFFCASADVVLFKSGDRLTGTVESVEAGKMAFVSKAVGKVTINLKDVQTFSADNPVEFVLEDGRVTKQQVSVSDREGMAKLFDGTEIELSKIVQINPKPKETVKWSGKVTAGVDIVRGNTQTTAENLAFEIARRSTNLRLSSNGNYYHKITENVSNGTKSTTVANWSLKGQADWFFTEKNYIYGNSRFEKDRVANLDGRITSGAGYGRQWIERADLNLSTEGGLTWVHERYQHLSKDRRYMAGRLAYHIDKTLWSKVKLYHNFEWIPSAKENHYYLVNSDVGVQAPLMARLAFDGKLQYAYNSDPSNRIKHADIRYIFGLSWIF